MAFILPGCIARCIRGVLLACSGVLAMMRIHVYMSRSVRRMCRSYCIWQQQFTRVALDVVARGFAYEITIR